MRIAVPVWSGRVSPVFDVARCLMIVEVIGGEATFTEQHDLECRDRVSLLSEIGVDVLLCGAVSQELEERVLAAGVELVMEIRGEADAVIRAYLDGGLAQPWFSMPGCHSRRRVARRPQSAKDLAAVRR
jgi:predicted Fe-Mo cluster-binding NifX family protein